MHQHLTIIEMLKFSTVFLTLIITTSDIRGATPLEGLQPGMWYEAPDSRLDAVKPVPTPPGNSSVKAVMAAWCGGCFDTKRSRLMVWGGGHADYAGNELYAFDVKSMKWSRICEPTPNDQITDIKEGREAYMDGKPSSRHTYDQLEYIPEQDWMTSNHGGIWCTGGSKNGMWVFDIANGKWIRKADCSESCQAKSAYDPVTKRLLVHENVNFSAWDPLTDKWTVMTKFDGGYWGSNNGSLDPERRLFVMIGAKKFCVYDLKTMRRLDVKTTGDKELEDRAAPGFEYDPVEKVFVGWDGGADVYVLNPENWSWKRQSNSPANKIVPTPAAKFGTYGRFRYVPVYRCFIAVNAVSENVFFYKMSKDK